MYTFAVYFRSVCEIVSQMVSMHVFEAQAHTHPGRLSPHAGIPSGQDEDWF